MSHHGKHGQADEKYLFGCRSACSETKGLVVTKSQFTAWHLWCGMLWLEYLFVFLSGISATVELNDRASGSFCRSPHAYVFTGEDFNEKTIGAPSARTFVK